MSKIQIATEIVKANANKTEAINAIMQELSVTKANAFVYWTKAAKSLGLPVGKQASVPGTTVAETTASPVVSRKTNPVTGTTPLQAARKVAEIDAVIAGLKASGVQASPLPA